MDYERKIYINMLGGDESVDCALPSRIQKTFKFTFAAFSLLSIVLLFYISYLYVNTYKILSEFEVSIQNITVEVLDSENTSIDTLFILHNPSEFSLKAEYFSEDLYLDGSLIGEKTVARYDRPLQIPRFSNATITINMRVSVEDSLLEASERNWNILIFILLSDVPLLKRGRINRFLHWSD